MIGVFSNYGGTFKFQADSSFKGRLSYIDTPLEKKSVVVKTKTLDFAYIKKYFYSVLVAEMSSLVIQFYYIVNNKTGLILMIICIEEPGPGNI